MTEQRATEKTISPAPQAVNRSFVEEFAATFDIRLIIVGIAMLAAAMIFSDGRLNPFSHRIVEDMLWLTGTWLGWATSALSLLGFAVLVSSKRGR